MSRRIAVCSVLPKILVGCITAVVFLLLLLPTCCRQRESSPRSSCQDNLKIMGLVFKMYSNESRGMRYPPLPDDPAIWTADVKTIYPEYLTDPLILSDPKSPIAPMTAERLVPLLTASPIDWARSNRVAAQDYVYLGWAVTCDEDVETLASLRAQGKLPSDVDTVTANGRTLYRLCEGVERFLITDSSNPATTGMAQSKIPIMFDVNAHTRHGRNVLYLDGHVALVNDGEFPSTRAVEKALGMPSAR